VNNNWEITLPVQARSAAKDQESFALLFDRYKNLVYRTAYLMLGDPAEAEEALQEVFVLVYKSLPSYDPEKGAFTTWLHRVTVNHCLGVRRKGRLSLQPLEGDHPNLVGEGVESRVARQAEQESVQQVLKDLSDKQRAVLVLRYYWEMPYAEISQVLKIPLGTVKSRIDLALRTLRERISHREERREPAPRSQEESADEM
jgi:RNA polymerase sigma-70 factor, ECF subfamily